MFHLAEHAVHCQVRAEQLKIRTQDDGATFKLNFHKTDITKLKIILEHTDWDNLVYNLPIAEAWEVFYGILHRAVTQTIPFRNDKHIGKRIFLTKHIRKLIRDRKKSYMDYIASGSISRLAKLQKLRSKLSETTTKIANEKNSRK